MRTGLNGFCAEASLEKRAAVVVRFVVGFGVAVEYKLGQVACRLIAILPSQEVLVIWLEAIRDHREMIGAAVFFDF